MIKNPDPNFPFLILNEGLDICSLSSYISTDILELVQRLDYVPLQLLKAWLPDKVSLDTIEMHLKSLEAANKLAYNRKLKIICGKHYLDRALSDAEKTQNKLMLSAASVLCYFKKASKEQELLFFSKTSYPTQIFLVTYDGFAADVTTLQPDFIRKNQPLRTVLPKYWAANLPEGEQDNICHIAVVPGDRSWSGFQQLLADAKRIGFDAYATFDAATYEATLKNF